MSNTDPQPEQSPQPPQPDWWDKVSREDFDGHSDFRRLTPEQKLMWLSQIQRFVALAKGKAVTRTRIPPPGER